MSEKCGYIENGVCDGEGCVGLTEVKAKWKEGKTGCKVQCPDGYICTRIKGHKKEHEAHTGDELSIARWPQ